MKFSALLVVCVLANVSVGQNWNWYYLKLPFNALPLFGFYDQPRTVADAEKEGWTLLSNECEEGAQFPGIRYTPPGPLDRIFIYDVNGYIAGMQSVVPKELTFDDKYYSFTEMPIYNLATVNGQEVFLTTAYFVDLDEVCTGRSDEDFEIYGTGHILHFVNGPVAAPENMLEAPLFAADADNDASWYEHYCFVNMGNHYFQFDTSATADCKTMFPVQLVYDHQGEKELIAFVWQHAAKLTEGNWEPVNQFAINAIVDNPPQCLLDATDEPGQSTMHVYLRDYVETCLF